MKIKEIASLAEVGVRTIQRDISTYNKDNGTDHSDSLKADLNDKHLLAFLGEKRGIDFAEVAVVSYEDSSEGVVRLNEPIAKLEVASDGMQNIDLVKDRAAEESALRAFSTKTTQYSSREPIKPRQKANFKPKSKKKKDLQTILSANWMVIVVLLVILWVDMFCFGVIGSHEFGDRWPLAWLPFAIIGLAVGFGSIVTYNRISNEKTANAWKYVFGVLQLCLFEFVINEWLVLSGGVAGLMFVIVSIGTQRSIKG